MTTPGNINPLAAHPNATPAPAAPANATLTAALSAEPKNAAEAKAMRDQLVRDKEFGAKVQAGDVQARGRLHALNQKIAAGDTADARIDAALAGIERVEGEIVTAENPLTTREIALGVRELRAAGLGDKTIEDVLRGVPITKEQSEAFKTTKSRLMRDREFGRLYLSGDVDARNFMKLLCCGVIAPVEEEPR